MKPVDHLVYARERKVEKMTFDSYDELHKIREFYPECKGLLLRILPDDSSAQCQLGNKYGAHIDVVPSLLRLAVKLGFSVKGVAYHVGSGATLVSAFTDAVRLARRVFDIAENMGIRSMALLDIGGGFPGGTLGSSLEIHDDTVNFVEIATQLRPLLDKLFPEEKGYSLMAEPGRYFVSSSGTLFTQIIGRRSPMYRENGSVLENTTRYYINDGVYGTFNNTIYDHNKVEGYTVFIDAFKRSDQSSDDEVFQETKTLNDSIEVSQASIWGPSCDGLDCVMKTVLLPELEVGDWLCFPNMGAYTLSAACTFNGFPIALKIYVY
jgi:ornithine decarboxylase